ncbi:MAG: non-hydrolyzing UDP-N-acetylglucosamine 2-epimerase [Pseudodesulfovibrio sp.]|uniref:non-hydrolyzing UDP-N-acetylglucosamine 2-epimerase n=1 Tax=Pseudodesulfovibrio sp. TaxID=2035812 RepID=UPI003D152B16
MVRVILVAGARPNFMKIAPLMRAAGKVGDIDYTLVHTGQHYDYEMSQAFFDDLGMGKPDYFLNAGSGSHAEQTASIMLAFEKVCLECRPDWVLVVGDVNSTLACAIVAKKLLINVAHVEAGLRSFDRTMPEEINRLVTDSISDLCFVTERSGEENLLKENHPESQVHFVGHVMIDNLLYQKEVLEGVDASAFAHAGSKPETGPYAFMTLHRPANVDTAANLRSIIEAIGVVAEKMPVIFPVHPRTRKKIDEFGMTLPGNIVQLPPLGFRESLWFWKDAQVVFTDSGGLQEETTALRIPCVTIRENTERPVTVEVGSNVLSGISTESILAAYAQALEKGKTGRIPDKWDGKASERIWKILKEFQAGQA